MYFILSGICCFRQESHSLWSRISPSLVAESRVIADLFPRLNWQRYAVVHSAEPLYVKMTETLLNTASKAKGYLPSKVKYVSNDVTGLKRILVGLYSVDVRVLVLFCGSKDAGNVLHIAQTLRDATPEYIWILPHTLMASVNASFTFDVLAGEFSRTQPESRTPY